VMRLLQLAAHREGIHRMELRVHSEVANYLLNRRRKEIAQLEESGELQIAIFGVIGVSPEMLQMTCYDRMNSEVKFPVTEPARLPERRGRR
jgi:ribonuclease E